MRSTTLLLPALLVLASAGCSGGNASSPSRPPASEPPRPSHPVQRGTATWYGARFQGRKTASGERFDQRDFTAAHRKLPFGTRVRVTNEKNGRSVIVRINDRGPFGSKRRIIDVSRAAAVQLKMLDSGAVPVRIEVLGR